MRERRTSYAFLMEMLWVCGFFAIAASVFVLAFVKADSLSRKASDLNQAVLLASNTIEMELADAEDKLATEVPSEITYYDKRTLTRSESLTSVYQLTVDRRFEDGLYIVSAEVAETDGTIIYSLSGCRAMEGGDL